MWFILYNVRDLKDEDRAQTDPFPSSAWETTTTLFPSTTRTVGSEKTGV